MQFSTKIQVFISYVVSIESIIIAEIIIKFIILQTEIRAINLKKKPINSLKISMFFKAIKGLNF